jgi:hypothetical protein
MNPLFELLILKYLKTVQRRVHHQTAQKDQPEGGTSSCMVEELKARDVPPHIQYHQASQSINGEVISAVSVASDVGSLLVSSSHYLNYTSISAL